MSIWNDPIMCDEESKALRLLTKMRTNVHKAVDTALEEIAKEWLGEIYAEAKERAKPAAK